MTKDSGTSTPSNRKYNLRNRKKQDEKERKKHESSDSEGNSDHSDSESEPEMNQLEYQKFLSKLFPSKHMSNKISQLEKFDKERNESSKSTKQSGGKKAAIDK